MKTITSILMGLCMVMSLSAQTTSKKTSKKKKRKAKTTAIAAKQEANVKYRLAVSFISMASGTDQKSIQKVDSFLATKAKKLDFVNQAWGREGEFDRYYTLKELSEKEQNNLVEGLKKLCEGNQMVIISENVENQRKRR
jgi:hypothetical protein